MDPGADARAPGGAVTAALCGHWEHEGPCRWPHNNSIDLSGDPAQFRTVFVSPTVELDELRARIESALTSGKGWTVGSAALGSLRDDERAVGERLRGAPRQDSR